MNNFLEGGNVPKLRSDDKDGLTPLRKPKTSLGGARRDIKIGAAAAKITIEDDYSNDKFENINRDKLKDKTGSI